MMPRHLPARQTVWQFMKEFGTATWRWVRRVYMIAGILILAATLLAIHFPDWFTTFKELQVQAMHSSLETKDYLQITPFYFTVLAQVIVYYGTGIAIGLAFIEALDTTTPAERTEQ